MLGSCTPAATEKADVSLPEEKEVVEEEVVPTLTPMPRGIIDPDIHVDIYHSDSVWLGTTLLPDNHNRDRPRVIEVNMLGEIVWEYQLPQDLRLYTNPGFDVEWLLNNNILLVLPLKGVYEVNRSGDIVWSYMDKKVSHDADRLPNGNTLVVFGGEDETDDAQVKEINPKGEIIWTWYARDHFYESPYKGIYNGGWTHANAVSRLSSGNTLISLRNFNFVVEVDSQGLVVRTIGEGIFHRQHDPEVLPNGNILVANHIRPQRAIEINPQTGEIVWQSVEFEEDASPIRDADRLPNGNTLITGTTKIVEVTPEGKIVWQLSLKGIPLDEQDLRGVGFYKADRIGLSDLTPQNGTTGTESREQGSSDNVGLVLSNDLIRDMERTRRSGDFDNVGLAIGETAVDFTLKDVDRSTVSLRSLLSEKPVVMVFGSFT